MFHDARTLESDTLIEGDVCIVGAGAAGIALANELDGRSVRVVLLESGSRRPDRRTQQLYAGDNIGRESFSTYHSRARTYGGSTTRWAGMSRPLEPMDFEARDWMPGSGWPFTLDELEPYYRRAHAVCQLGPYDYDPDRWSTEYRPALPVDTSALETRVYRFGSPRDLGRAFEGDLASSRNVDVYLNANVVEIESEAGSRGVTGLRVAKLDGGRFRVQARHYVLACGGLENPRLLLASNRVESHGLGNRNDLVGRYFMDHPFLWMGYLEPSKPEYQASLNVIQDYELGGSEQPAFAAFSLPERTVREERLNGCVVYFIKRSRAKTIPTYFAPATRSLVRLTDLARLEDVSDRHVGRHVRTVAAGLGDVGRHLAHRLGDVLKPRNVMALRVALEATPNRDSRVMLGPTRDRLGMPRIQVDWRLNADDRRGLHRTWETVAREIARLGLGRVTGPPAEEADGWPASFSSGMHHMGTTRMHPDPARGVVDADCRVHDQPNLYIAGSSVFPTGGVANPTLTIVALAIRLADHLAGKSDEAVHTARSSPRSSQPG